MKRKTETKEQANGQPDYKKRALSSEEAAARFRDGLFDSAEQQKYTKEYAQSAPYVCHRYRGKGIVMLIEQIQTWRDMPRVQ